MHHNLCRDNDNFFRNSRIISDTTFEKTHLIYLFLYERTRIGLEFFQKMTGRRKEIRKIVWKDDTTGKSENPFQFFDAIFSRSNISIKRIETGRERKKRNEIKIGPKKSKKKEDSRKIASDKFPSCMLIRFVQASPQFSRKILGYFRDRVGRSIVNDRGNNSRVFVFRFHVPLRVPPGVFNRPCHA